jgi:hypothetical protein
VQPWRGILPNLPLDGCQVVLADRIPLHDCIGLT